MSYLSETAVLIVGAGPVGLTLALDLARRGVPCRIIEQSSTYAIGTRGRSINGRTQEIFEQLGVLAPLSAYVEPNRPWRFYGCGNQIIREIDPGADPATRPSPEAPYRAPILVNQAHTEAVLRACLASYGIQVKLDSQLVGFVHDADGVAASVAHAGAIGQIRARYLIGCDGGRSTVRKLAGIAFLGETWEQEHHLLANLSVSGLDQSYWHFWTEPDTGTAALWLNWMSRSGTWFFMSPVAPDASGALPPPTLATLQQLFDQRAGLPGVSFGNATWLSLWRPSIRIVDRYRVGRILLAGDAAHVHSAAGGQGLNTGVQDAYNLGWKLALALNGAPDSLLDAYQAERLPVAQGVLETTSRWHQQRDFARALTNAVAVRETFADASQLSITYRGSPLDCDCDRATGIRAGDRAPDAPCIQAASREPIRLFDAFRGTHFTLLAFGDRPAPRLPQAYADSVRAWSISPPGMAAETDSNTLIDSTGLARRAYGVRDEASILIRPVGYVGLTAGSLDPAPVVDYLHKITGR